MSNLTIFIVSFISFLIGLIMGFFHKNSKILQKIIEQKIKGEMDRKLNDLNIKITELYVCLLEIKNFQAINFPKLIEEKINKKDDAEWERVYESIDRNKHWCDMNGPMY